MKKAALLACLCCTLFACEDIEKKAGEKLQAARLAFEQGDYSEAKKQIDSIKILYPKAFETRRAGIGLMQEVELKEQEQSLAYLDSMLQVKQQEFDAVKSKFAFEKDAEYQQEQENGAANSGKVEEALSWQESFPNDEVSREFLDRFVPRIFSIDGQKFIWELNLFQESCTVQCNVRGTYNYHSISAERTLPGKSKAKKGDGAVSRILEDANSTRFWVHAYDDDPISRLLSSRLAADLPASITIKLNYEQARAYRNSRGYVLWLENWKDLTVKVVL